MFINLAAHSHYSLLMSSMSIDDIINFAVRQKQKYVALVDINVMYGTIEFYNKAIANKLHPVIGLKITWNNQPAILIAKNNNGYHNLIKLSSAIMSETVYRIDDYINDLYIIVDDVAKSYFKNSKDAYSISSSGLRPIALQESFFENKGEERYLKTLMAIHSESRLEDLTLNREYDDKYMLTSAEANKKFSSEAIKNLSTLLESCSWSINYFEQTHFVKYDPKYNSRILLQNKCKDGLKLRLNSETASKEYIERLIKELEIIDKMNFNDYFLVVQDYVNFAKEKNILVGPGRGSAAGSLVAYVLGITEIDPIEHNLIFERFLNPERATMPDIDIDFMDNRRNEVIEYLFERYGKERVAHILTFQRMKAKMAIRDVGRVLGIELPIINSIAKLFTMDFDLDIDGAIKNNKNIANFASKYPELFDYANKFLNFPRQVGLHAAGVIITNSNLTEYLPISNSTDGLYATQYSMEYLEPLGLIKMDILGLINLTTISETLQLIKNNHNKSISLNQIDLHDRAVFQQLARGDTIGIFQLESPGMRSLIMKIKPISIEDISITSSLFRPGPQKNIPTYLENKAHPDKIKYLNADFQHVLSPTFNVIIYQEQVIEIVQRVAKFSLAQSDLFRRAISKKNAEKLNQLHKEFATAGIKNGYSQQEVETIYEYIFNFANYGFNHSHSLAYSYISYWMAYLKAYWPLEYFSVLLSTSDNSIDRVISYTQAAKANGIEIIPPSINESQYSFSIKDKSIVFGFNSIKGIGRETVLKILNIRSQMPQNHFKNYQQVVTSLANNAVGIKATELLIKSGCLDDLLKQEKKTRLFLLHNLNEIYEKSKTTLQTGEMIIKPKLEDVKETAQTKADLSRQQLELLGMSFDEHPLISIKKAYKGEYQIYTLNDIDSQNTVGHAIAMLVSYREIKTKTNQPMAFAKIEDETRITDIVIFPGVYEKVKSLLKPDNYYIVTIKPGDRGLQALDLKEYRV